MGINNNNNYESETEAQKKIYNSKTA